MHYTWLSKSNGAECLSVIYGINIHENRRQNMKDEEWSMNEKDNYCREGLWKPADVYLFWTISFYCLKIYRVHWNYVFTMPLTLSQILNATIQKDTENFEGQHKASHKDGSIFQKPKHEE